MSLRAGLLNEVITIKEATITKNSFGEEVETYSNKYTTRARVIQTNSNRTTENNEITVDFTKEFQIRIYVPIEEFDIIEWRGKLYRIVSLNVDRHNQYITVIGDLIND